jgi:hypothetical protein
MTMVEKVARAICCASGKSPDHCPQVLGSVIHGQGKGHRRYELLSAPAQWKEYEMLARVAIETTIEAMRETNPPNSLLDAWLDLTLGKPTDVSPPSAVTSQDSTAPPA